MTVVKRQGYLLDPHIYQWSYRELSPQGHPPNPRVKECKLHSKPPVTMKPWECFIMSTWRVADGKNGHRRGHERGAQTLHDLWLWKEQLNLHEVAVKNCTVSSGPDARELSSSSIIPRPIAQGCVNPGVAQYLAKGNWILGIGLKFTLLILLILT